VLLIKKLLLVDFENVQQVDLSRLDDSTDVIIFVGASQKSIPIELVTSAQKLGTRIEWQKVEGNGKNALDFHIACHLGRVLEKSPQFHCIVLSKDKGFDPLLRQLNKIGLKCKRINSLLELDPRSAPVEDSNYKRVLEILGKSEKKGRPRKLKTLSQHISSIFQKKIEQKDIDHIIDMLFANKMISETNNIISYDF
jgi:PIN domain